MNSETVKDQLINLGGSEWKKGDHHRVYIEGYVAAKFFDSDHARFGKAHKTFFNVVTGQFSSSSMAVKNNLNIMMESK